MLDFESIKDTVLTLCFAWNEVRERFEAELLIHNTKVICVLGNYYNHNGAPSQEGEKCFRCRVRKVLHENKPRNFYVIAVQVIGPSSQEEK